MFPSFQSLKPAILGVAVLMVALLKWTDARAADLQTAIVAGGCFWCVEADFEKVDGVIGVVSGYSGGNVENPTYRQVSGGGTGHLEVAQITYDADRISYAQILQMFLRSIDPLDAGGQFCDRGMVYTTAIFVETPAERAAAKAAIAQAEAELGQSIVTPIRAAKPFYPAEDYHQDYYKSSKIVLTRRGPKSKAAAYKFYRDACGRDARVREIWGKAAPFAMAGS